MKVNCSKIHLKLISKFNLSLASKLNANESFFCLITKINLIL